MKIGTLSNQEGSIEEDVIQKLKLYSSLEFRHGCMDMFTP